MLPSPYGYDYDVMVVATAIAFLASGCLEYGWRPSDKTALATLWLVPMVTRGIASATFIPLGVITMIAAYVVILHSVATDTRESKQAPAAAAP